MSGHADTIRVAEGVLAGEPGARYMGVDRDLAERALALVAENQRLRDALERIESICEDWDTHDSRYAWDFVESFWRALGIARTALAGAPSEDT
jgi:hypothetical protein